MGAWDGANWLCRWRRVLKTRDFLALFGNFDARTTSYPPGRKAAQAAGLPQGKTVPDGFGRALSARWCWGGGNVLRRGVTEPETRWGDLWRRAGRGCRRKGWRAALMPGGGCREQASGARSIPQPSTREDFGEHFHAEGVFGNPLTCSNRLMEADLNEVAYGHGSCGRVILSSRGSPVQRGVPLAESHQSLHNPFIAKGIHSSSIAGRIGHFLQVAPIESAAARIFLCCVRILARSTPDRALTTSRS